jgi:isoleucyl-tRNA synthetase
MYANIDGFQPQETRNKKQETNNLLDKWIVSELNILIESVNVSMEKYELNKAVRLFPNFIDELSNIYIRRSRKRFWKSEDDSDKKAAYETLHYVLVELSKLMAPFCPFIAEEIYKNLTNEESVHLEKFPIKDNSLLDHVLDDEMSFVWKIIRGALNFRAKAGIKVRQPLQSISVKQFNVREELKEIILDEVNVKEIKIDENLDIPGVGDNYVSLNTEITEDLKLEGQAREIVRFIQEMRKVAGYDVENRISVSYQGMEKVFGKFGKLIAKEVLANEIKSEKLKKFDAEKEFNIDGEKIYPVKSPTSRGAEQFNRVKIQIKR